MTATFIVQGHEVEICPNCEGAGFIPVGISSGPQHPGQTEFDGCPTCGGTGTR